MTRLERKNRTDIIFKGCGGLTDLADDAIKEGWRINDKEFDFLCEFGSDDVLHALAVEHKTFTERRKALNDTNLALWQYYTEGNGQASNNPT